MKSKLSADDPVYYKYAIKKLLKQAEEHGLKISAVVSGNDAMIYFKSDIGECAGVKIENKDGG